MLRIAYVVRRRLVTKEACLIFVRNSGFDRAAVRLLSVFRAAETISGAAAAAVDRFQQHLECSAVAASSAPPTTSLKPAVSGHL